MSQKMIPLHIADQAVAAVEDELAKVKAERDQLKADLEKSDGVVWTLSAENVHLKAEIERLTKAGEMSGNNLKRCYCQECENARKELHARIALKKGGKP